MLTFMNSKLPDKLVVLTNKTKFSKKLDPMKYPVQKYILVRTWNLSFMYFTVESHYVMKSILNVKKKYLAWLKLYLVKIFALESKFNKQKKNHLSLTVPKPFDFSQNYFVPFHWVTFDHSISCVLLIDKPNERCKNSKKIEKNALSITLPQKKLLKIK